MQVAVTSIIKRTCAWVQDIGNLETLIKIQNIVTEDAEVQPLVANPVPKKLYIAQDDDFGW